MHWAICVGLQVDVQAQRFQHIGAAALAADAAPAVLADLGARGGGDKHGAGGDVEGVASRRRPVPTMSTKWVLSATSTLVENSRITCAAAGDFANGFLLDAQAR